MPVERVVLQSQISTLPWNTPRIHVQYNRCGARAYVMYGLVSMVVSWPMFAWCLGCPHTAALRKVLILRQGQPTFHDFRRAPAHVRPSANLHMEVSCLDSLVVRYMTLHNILAVL